jgi:hypothetical protein
MKVSVEAKPLRAALDDISGVVRRGVDILECVQITAADNTLRLIATDMEIEAHAQVEASIPEGGKCCVNAADFKYAISAANDLIEFSVSDEGLAIAGRHSRAVLPVRVDEFPRLPRPDQMEEIEGGVRAFLACVPAASKDESFWHLTGVGFNGESAVGSNGKNARMFPASGGSGQMVPARAKAIISKIKGRLFVGEALWKIENQDRVVVGKLIDSKCPDLSKLPQDLPLVWNCSAEDLASAIDAVSFKRAAFVLMSGAPQGIQLSGEKFTGTHIDTRADIKADGPGATVVCSVSSMAVSLEGMSGDLEVKTNGSAIEILSGQLRAMCTVISDHRNTAPEAEAPCA